MCKQIYRILFCGSIRVLLYNTCFIVLNQCTARSVGMKKLQKLDKFKKFAILKRE